jgi:ligand-binding sensor domain-containing protein/serine phosphatase RsbU (regulator of sigma subunit)
MEIKSVHSYIKVIRFFYLVTLFFSLPLSFVNGQTFFFEKLGVEQGLGSSKVYTIYQDDNDWIWLGTESGVSRFDGLKFENFSSADGMAGNGVKSIASDTLGRIWLGHLNGGISVYDNGRFSKFRYDSIKIDGDISEIRYFKGYLWISTSNNGAIRTDVPERGDSVLTGRQYMGRDGLSLKIASSCVDKKNNLYFVTDDVGIKKFNPGKEIFETFRPDSLTRYFSTTFMFEDSKGNFWYGTRNGGLYKFVKSSGRMMFYDIRDGLAHQFTSFITEDYKGNIWVGSWGGGITVFSGDKMFVYDKADGLEATSIHCILEDKEKNMIIADHYTGISIYKGDHFVTYSGSTFLPDNSVFSIEEDETGRYWFGTNAGISVFNPAPDAKPAVQFFTDDKNSIGNKIRFLKSDHIGNIWIGTEDRGVIRYDLKKNKFIYDIRIGEFLHSNNFITALEIDKKNRIWIGNMDRLVVWDQEKEQARFFTQNNGIAGNSISSLFCDSNGDIWIGSESGPRMGLTKLSVSSEKFQIIDIGEGFVPKTITQTPDKTIWVGTTSGLLAIRDDKVVYYLNNQNGLLSNNINLLRPDGSGFLYIGTNYGLNRFSFSDSTIALFTRRNGFQGIETKPNASFRDSHGNLWFGTANGVTRLTPEKMPPVFTSPMTHISSMTVKYQPHEMTNDLRLSYKENSILFNFYSVCLVNPEAVRYKFMLKGADEDWSPATVSTMKDYSALSPGHYTFSVIASNGYGYWNTVPAEYSFIIKPPFYQTPWFIGICLMAAAFGVVLVIQIRERNLRHEKKVLEQKVVERTAEVVQKSKEIEEKNRDITASIRYAERIQRAMLSREDVFPETFVLYMPKDIVSGDFYWMHDSGEMQFVAACDCTGHGVPGAFMSIIGYNSLNKVVKEYGITEPGPILDQLDSEIVNALMQRHEETIKDGMDMALIAFDRKKFTMEFAGAYNPLYVVRKGELFTYKSDRFPIGMSSQRAKKSFQTQLIDIRPGDMVYMCSDGYADQFGAVSAKKFKSGNVKRLLCEIWDLPVDKQRERLEKEILDWKGDYAQIDDIMFIGLRVPEI